MALAAIALALPMAARGATPQATVQAANGADYAANELGNPWDMDSITDIAFELTRDTGNVTNLRFEDGKLKATAVNSDPRVSLLQVSHPVVNPVLPEGGYRPINADKYKYLTIRLNSPITNKAQVIWLEAMGQQYQTSSLVNVQPGWNTLSFDLSAEGAWRGYIQGLFFDPFNGNGNFEIDYVRLTDSKPDVSDNTPPQLEITSPSYISGRDYATTVIGNPWDMSDAADVALQYNLTGGRIENGTFRASSVVGSDDPGVHLNVTTPIDTTKYHYATYRLRVDGQQDTVNGSVSRLFWWTTSDGSGEASVSTDIVVYEGYRTVSIDLTKIKLQSGPSWLASNPRVFRLDAHEFRIGRSFDIDYVMLTADSIATTSYDIRYNASDADDNALTTSFFYFPEAQPGSTTPITCATQSKVNASNTRLFLPLVGGPVGAPVQSTGATCTWNTAAIPNGAYYVVVQSSDGTNTTTVTSQTPVIVQR